MTTSTRWLLGILGLLVLALFFLVPVCPCDDWDFYEAEGEALHAGVLSYWAKEGKLPTSLRSVKRRISERVSASWEYEASQDPPYYRLSIGSYYLCGCDLYGRLRSKWSLDLQGNERPVKAQALALLHAAVQYKVEHGRFPALAADFAIPVPEGWTYSPPQGAPDWYQPPLTIQEGRLGYHGQEGSLALIFELLEWQHDT